MPVSLRLEVEASIEHEPSSGAVTREMEGAGYLGMVTRARRPPGSGTYRRR